MKKVKGESYSFSKYKMGDSKPIVLNVPQLMMILSKQKTKVLEGGRGLGKSTIISWFLKEMAEKMPRGHFTIFGKTYSQMLTSTLPGTIAGLEMFGYRKDKRFCVNHRAPRKWRWDEAYQPPLNDYENTIHWHNGSTFSLVSLDMADGGRGRNRDGAIGDEVALADYERYIYNVNNTIRGNDDKFEKCALHKAQVLTTSVPMTNEGKWIFDLEQEAINKPEEVFYLRADSFHNQHNLGDKFFKDARRLMTDMIYNAEILNIRPGKVEGGFYPTFNEKKHCRDIFNNSYLRNLGLDSKKAIEAKCLADADLSMDRPIDVACDYGGHINTIVSHQEVMNEARWLSAMYIKSPELIDKLINNFCDYYEGFILKEVNYWYDHTALGGKVGTSAKTYKEIVVETFINKGWKVHEYDIGLATGHRDRFLFWGISFQETETRLPIHRFNSTNCKYLIVSINNTGLIQGRKGEEKDKRPEKNKKVAQEEAPHFSDAMDTIGYGKYGERLKDSNNKIWW